MTETTKITDMVFGGYDRGGSILVLPIVKALDWGRTAAGWDKLVSALIDTSGTISRITWIDEYFMQAGCGTAITARGLSLMAAPCSELARLQLSRGKPDPVRALAPIMKDVIDAWGHVIEIDIERLKPGEAPIYKAKPRQLTADERREHRREERQKTSLVYLIRDGHGAVKIGQSQCPKRRIVQLQMANATELEILATWPNVGPGAESKLHRRFEKKRLIGEWFDLSPQDIHDLIRQFGK